MISPCCTSKKMKIFENPAIKEMTDIERGDSFICSGIIKMLKNFQRLNAKST